MAKGFCLDLDGGFHRFYYTAFVGICQTLWLAIFALDSLIFLPENYIEFEAKNKGRNGISPNLPLLNYIPSESLFTAFWGILFRR